MRANGCAESHNRLRCQHSKRHADILMAQVSSVQLAEAPAAFLPEQWMRFRAAYLDDRRALDDLSNDALQWIGFYAGRAMRDQRDFDGMGAETVARAELAKEIISVMQRMLSEGALVATGMQPPGLERVDIPQDLWAGLKLGFADNSARDTNFSFAHIRVSRAPLDPGERVRRCVAWLTEQDDRTKKIVKLGALDKISGLTTREFNDAYKIAFNSSVGRPRKTTEK